MQLLRAQLKPQPNCTIDYSALPRRRLLELINTKDAEINNLRRSSQVAQGQVEVELSFARSKLVQLMDTLLELDQEIFRLRELNSSLKLRLDEQDKLYGQLLHKFKECQKDARLNQLLLSEYEQNDQERLIELDDRLETAKALQRTLAEEIIYTNELKQTNQVQRDRIQELERLCEKQRTVKDRRVGLLG
jgi:hypothetical protein